MKNFNLLLNNFISDESGQDLIEYALVASAISLAAVASLSGIAGSITTIFASIATKLGVAAALNP